jgi:hypothetical protein
MPRYFPVLRIGFLVGCGQVQGWRRANQRNRYGAVTIVDGRQVVTLAAIERAENKFYTPEQVAIALERPLSPPTRRSEPPKPRINLPNKKFTRRQAERMVLDLLRRRDIQWKAWLTRSLNHTPDDNIATE